jgi:hypothetical protein
VAVANGGHFFPPLPRRDAFLPHGLAAPGRDNHFRIPPNDFCGRDDAFLAKLPVSQLGKIGSPPAISTSSSTSECLR